MQSFEISVLLATFGAMGLVAYHWSVAKELRQSRRETSRFKMFAVRDQLVDLVLDGKMDEDNEAWRSTYHGVNVILGLHEELHGLDCLMKYLRRTVAIERSPVLKRRLDEMRRQEDEAGRAIPEFKKATADAVVAFAHLVRQRTTLWHRTAMMMIVACLALAIVAIRFGLQVALGARRSMTHPSSDVLKLWDDELAGGLARPIP
jgi:hypothetical protein